MGNSPAKSSSVSAVKAPEEILSSLESDMCWDIPNYRTTNDNSMEPSVITIAGNGTTGYSCGLASECVLHNPSGLTVDNENNILFHEYYNHRTRKITKDNQGRYVIDTIAGSGSGAYMDGAAPNAHFYSPCGIAVDPEGTVFVVDHNNHRIRKISKGIVSTIAGSGFPGYVDGRGSNASFNSPCGMALDAQNNLIVADYQNHRIRKVTPDGDVTTLAGSGVKGFLDGEASVAQFNLPTGVCVDQEGNILVADSDNHRIRKITKDGRVSTIAGTGNWGYSNGKALQAQLYHPCTLCPDYGGNIFIADYNNHAIRKLTPDGQLMTVAGGSKSGFKDGDLSSAAFFRPYGVIVDAVGDLWVTDNGNQRIRKITGVAVGKGKVIFRQAELFKSDIRKMKKDTSMCDTEIILNDQRHFLVHSVILAARCPFLWNQVQENRPNAGSLPRFSIRVVDPELSESLMQSFIDYLYFEDWNFEEMEKAEIKIRLVWAQKFDLPALVAVLEKRKKRKNKYQAVDKLDAIQSESMVLIPWKKYFESYQFLVPQTTDVVLVFEKIRVPAHKCLLSARSAMLASMLTHNFVEATRTEVPINLEGVIQWDSQDDLLSFLQIIFRFIYCGMLSGVTENSAIAIFQLWKYFDLGEMHQQLQDMICSTQLSEDNYNDLWEFAVQYGFQPLMEKVGMYIAKNIHHLCSKYPETVSRFKMEELVQILGHYKP